jgi:hypothetical protein
MTDLVQIFKQALTHPECEAMLEKIINRALDKRDTSPRRPENRKVFPQEAKKLLGLSEDSKTNNGLVYHQNKGLKWHRGRPNWYYLHDILDYIDSRENQRNRDN